MTYIREVVILGEELDRALRFYHQTLGVNVMHRTFVNDVLTLMLVGKGIGIRLIVFTKTEARHTAIRKRRGDAQGMYMVRDPEETARLFEANGALRHPPPVPKVPQVVRIGVTDPFGYLWDFVPQFQRSPALLLGLDNTQQSPHPVRWSLQPLAVLSQAAESMVSLWRRSSPMTQTVTVLIGVAALIYGGAAWLPQGDLRNLFVELRTETRNKIVEGYRRFGGLAVLLALFFP